MTVIFIYNPIACEAKCQGNTARYLIVLNFKMWNMKLNKSYTCILLYNNTKLRSLRASNVTKLTSPFLVFHNHVCFPILYIYCILKDNNRVVKISHPQDENRYWNGHFHLTLCQTYVKLGIYRCTLCIWWVIYHDSCRQI